MIHTDANRMLIEVHPTSGHSHRSLFGGHMDRDDTAGQICIRHLAEPCLAEHLAKPFLIGKRANRGRQIFVDPGGVARDFRADPGQQPE